jgi:hypothetical protein
MLLSKPIGDDTGMDVTGSLNRRSGPTQMQDPEPGARLLEESKGVTDGRIILHQSCCLHDKALTGQTLTGAPQHRTYFGTGTTFKAGNRRRIEA